LGGISPIAKKPYTMNDYAIDSNRMKAAMIIFSFERALGDLVKLHAPGNREFKSTGTAKMIVEREELAGSETGTTQVQSLVAASYFNEVIDLAIASCDETSLEDDLRGLSDLVLKYDIFTIRNAISHPNRPFPESYFYLTAALASDPIIDRLELNSVRAALQMVESNTIDPPPEEWLDRSFSAVPNNLPREFEHQMTGLVGRKKELKALEELFLGSRYGLVAIVAPGGVGKTALILDVLKKCSSDIRSHEWCDGIVFVSLKQETLTASGVKGLSNSATVQELREEVTEILGILFPEVETDSFEDCLLNLKDKKILMCVDNLETLLRDAPEIFSELYETIPDSWTVIVTSRVTVDAAKTVTLRSLTNESAKGLASKYIEAKGVGAVTGESLQTICEASNNNPLAIRLTVDRFSLGRPISEASKYAHADVVSFSYTNLVETLTPVANKVLECLFACGKLRRSDLIDLLKLNADEAAQAISDLLKTSLAILPHDSSSDELELGQSVRELLREHPKDLVLREEIRKAISQRSQQIQQHQSIQRNYGFSKHSEDWIPEDLSPAVSSHLVKAVRLLRSDERSHKQLINMISALEGIAFNHNKNFRILITLGRLYLEVGDEMTAENMFKGACEIANGEPAALLRYGEFLLTNYRSGEALEIFRKLEGDGWASPDIEDKFILWRTTKNILRALIESGKYDESIKFASSYTGDDSASENASISAAYALIKKASSEHGFNQELAVKCFFDAATRLGKKPQSDYRAVIKFWKTSIRYFLREGSHLIGKNINTETLQDKLLDSVCIIEPFIAEAYDRPRFSELLVGIVREFRNLGRPANPFLKGIWAEYCGESEDHEERVDELVKIGYSIAIITRIPQTSDVPKFLFAKTEDGQPIFVPSACVVEIDWIKWSRLIPGSKIAYALLEEGGAGGELPVANNVYLI